LRIENTKIKTYKEAMKNMGGQPLVHRVDSHRIDGGYKAGPKLVEILQKHDATAVFCCQDELAIGLMNYMYDNNIKVPEDVSVVGYGDISVAGIYRPALTTIREPYYDIGAVAIRKILKELIGESIDDRNIELPVRLIKRKSSQRI
ncbi:MAG TPA: substrate-binding domain-containing protein, partial [Tissierellaceae bacterium]|nr:substrate-binding domain-containing protein [Tissierellaceae bacterium]